MRILIFAEPFVYMICYFLTLLGFLFFICGVISFFIYGGILFFIGGGFLCHEDEFVLYLFVKLIMNLIFIYLFVSLSRNLFLWSAEEFNFYFNLRTFIFTGGI